MASFIDALRYAREQGNPQLAKDYYLRRKFNESYESGELIDEVSPVADFISGADIQQPGDFEKILKTHTSPIMDALGGASSIDKLRSSVGGSDPIEFLKKQKPPNLVEELKSYDPASTAGVGAEEEPDGFIMGNIKSAYESNKGFAKLMGGMLANGVGIESLGQALKASADLNFEQAEKYAKSESFEENPLAWAGQVLLQQVPEIGMTLAAGTLSWGVGWGVGFAGMLGKSAAKEAVKASLKSALTKGLVAKGVKEGAEEMVEAALKDEVVDSITKVGLRDAFFAQGREAYAKNFAKAMGKEGIDLGEDVLKDAALKGAKGRALRSPGTFAAAGSLTAGVLTTDGDIAKDLYDEAKRLRTAKVQQLVAGGMKEAEAIEQANKEISDPTLGDMGVAAFLAPMLDSVVPLMALKKVGALGGSGVTGFLKHVAEAEGGSAILKSLPASIIKNSFAEGTTEALQGATSEYAKKVYMDNWEKITPEQKMTTLDYLLRPEAKARYLAEFGGGALMGGVLGGITQKAENMGEQKAQTKAEAFHQALKDKIKRKADEEKAAVDAALVPEKTYSNLTEKQVSRLFQLAGEDVNMSTDTRVATLTAKKEAELRGATDATQRAEITKKYDDQIAEITAEPAKPKEPTKKEQKAAAKDQKAKDAKTKIDIDDLNTQIIDVDAEISKLGVNDGVKRAELTTQRDTLQGKLDSLTNPQPKVEATPTYRGPLKKRLDALTAALATEKNPDTKLAIEEDLAKVQADYDTAMKLSSERKSEVELANELTALDKDTLLTKEAKDAAIKRVQAKLNALAEFTAPAEQAPAPQAQTPVEPTAPQAQAPVEQDATEIMDQAEIQFDDQAPVEDEQSTAVSRSVTEAKTGEPITISGWRGEGKPKEEIYMGAQVAIAGEGRYIASTEQEAREYGDKVQQESITLQNPLVVSTDAEWRQLVKTARWPYPNILGLKEEDVKKLTSALQKSIQDQGHDGLVITLSSNGDEAKTLRNVFGHDQAISYTKPNISDVSLSTTQTNQGVSNAVQSQSPISNSSLTITSEGGSISNSRGLQETAPLALYQSPEGETLSDKTLDLIYGYKGGVVNQSRVHLPGAYDSSNPIASVDGGKVQAFKDDLNRTIVMSVSDPVHDGERLIKGHNAALVTSEDGKTINVRITTGKQSKYSERYNRQYVLASELGWGYFGPDGSFNELAISASKMFTDGNNFMSDVAVDMKKMFENLIYITEDNSDVYVTISNIAEKIPPKFETVRKAFEESVNKNIVKHYKDNSLNGMKLYSIEDEGGKAGDTWAGFKIELGPSAAELKKMADDTQAFFNSVLPDGRGLLIWDDLAEKLPDMATIIAKGKLSFVLDTQESWGENTAQAYIQRKDYGHIIHINPIVPAGVTRLHAALHELGHFIDSRYFRSARGKLMTEGKFIERWKDYAEGVVKNGADESAKFVRGAYEPKLWSTEYFAESVAEWLLRNSKITKGLKLTGGAPIDERNQILDTTINLIQEMLDAGVIDNSIRYDNSLWKGSNIVDPTSVGQIKVYGILKSGKKSKVLGPNVDPQFAKGVSTGTSIEALNNWLDQNTPGFLANANIQVVTSERFPQGGEWQGAYKNGTIYINADTMTGADMKRILFHEALGHAVAREILGKDYDGVMRTLLKELKRSLAGKEDITVGSTSLRALLKTYEDQLFTKDGKIDPRMAEELWAKYIEAHAEGRLSDKNILFKIFEAIRDWVIKATGFEVRTLSAVDRLAARAVRFAEFNSAGVNGEAQFARQTPTTPSSQPVDERAAKAGTRILGIKMPRMFEESAVIGRLETMFNKNDINDFDLLFRPLQALGEKVYNSVPQVKKMVMELQQMSDKFTSLYNGLETTASPFFRASKQDLAAVEPALVKGDIDNVEYTTAQEAGLNESQFAQYKSVRAAFNKARDVMVADAKRALDLLKERIGQQQNVAPLFNDQIKRFEAAISTLSSRKGYIPHNRPQTAHYELQFELDGKMFVKYIDVQGTPGKNIGNRMARELEAKGAKPLGAATKIEPVLRKANVFMDTDSDLGATQVAEMSSIINKVLQDKDGKMPEGVDELLKTMFYAKSFAQHYIHRKKASLNKDTVSAETGNNELDVIHGYETSGLAKGFREYFQGVARQSSKAETSFNLLNIFQEKKADGSLVFDLSDRSTAGINAAAKRALKAAKGSADEYTTAVRWANTIAYHAHIGLRISSCIWNMTHLHMFGTGTLRTEMVKAGAKNIPSFADMAKGFVGAHKDALVFGKTKMFSKDKTAPVSLADMGWRQDKAKLLDALNQYFATAQGTTLSEQIAGETDGFGNGLPKRMWGQYKRMSGFFMHHSELTNKLASFQMHYQNMGGDFNEAKHFVRLLNGSYEKWNMPGYLQGKGAGSAAAQILLNTFRTHVVNTYEIMGSMWKHDKASLAYSMAAATIMGGVPGKLALDMLIRLLWGVAEGEDQYQGSYYKMNEDLFGEGAAKFMKGGLANYVDFVDPSASIGIGPHPVSDAIGYLTGKGSEAAFLAPVTGFFKAMIGEAPAYKMMPIKSIQSLWQAGSDMDQIQIGTRKIFNPDGTPMKLARWEAALVSIGMNPARKSSASGLIWEDYQVNDFFNTTKSNIVNAMKEATTIFEKMDAAKQMQEFNKNLMDVKRNPAYDGVVKTKPISPADAKRGARGEKILSKEL